MYPGRSEMGNEALGVDVPSKEEEAVDAPTIAGLEEVAWVGAMGAGSFLSCTSIITNRKA